MSNSFALSPEALIEMLQEPDWRVDYARVACALGPDRALRSATLVDGMLRFEFGKFVVEKPAEVILRDKPGHVRVKNTYIETRMRKKVDGGGWHDVPVLQRTIWLSNPRMMQDHANFYMDAMRQRIEKEREAKKLEAERARNTFIAALNSVYEGERLSRIESVAGGGIVVIFVSGRSIEIKPAEKPFRGPYLEINNSELP